MQAGIIVVHGRPLAGGLRPWAARAAAPMPVDRMPPSRRCHRVAIWIRRAPAERSPRGMQARRSVAPGLQVMTPFPTGSQRPPAGRSWPQPPIVTRHRDSPRRHDARARLRSRQKMPCAQKIWWQEIHEFRAVMRRTQAVMAHGYSTVEKGPHSAADDVVCVARIAAGNLMEFKRDTPRAGCPGAVSRSGAPGGELSPHGSRLRESLRHAM